MTTSSVRLAEKAEKLSVKKLENRLLKNELRQMRQELASLKKSFAKNEDKLRNKQKETVNLRLQLRSELKKLIESQNGILSTPIERHNYCEFIVSLCG